MQFLDQGLKGQIPMRLGRQHHLAHPPQQVAKAGMARQVGAQHQRVFKQADQRLGLSRACDPP